MTPAVAAVADLQPIALRHFQALWGAKVAEVELQMGIVLVPMSMAGVEVSRDGQRRSYVLLVDTESGRVIAFSPEGS